jgi:hypothetical protein
MSGVCALGHERTCLVYLDVRFTRKRISGRAAKASLLALDGLFNSRLPIIISPDRRPDPAKGTWQINPDEANQCPDNDRRWAAIRQ